MLPLGTAPLTPISPRTPIHGSGGPATPPEWKQRSVFPGMAWPAMPIPLLDRCACGLAALAHHHPALGAQCCPALHTWAGKALRAHQCYVCWTK
ncbi:MAG TPA: hypothetical protein VGO47_02895 [Chlamydiales bacterium]|nr:hypothetical protein [Chlamydiales bacterium]